MHCAKLSLRASAFVVSLFSLVTSAHGADCHLQVLASLDLTTTPHGEFLVPVSVAGTPRTFALQLGDTVSAINGSTAEALSLKQDAVSPPPGSSSITLFGQENPVSVHPSFDIGQLHFQQAELVVVPPTENRTYGTDGVIGLDLLRSEDVELDIAHRKLRVFLPGPCVADGVFANAKSGYLVIPMTYQKAGSIQIAMKLDGIPIVAGITTTGPSQMGMQTANRLFGLIESSPGMQRIADNAPCSCARFTYPFKKLETEGMAIANPAIEIHKNDPGSSCNGIGHLEKRLGGGFYGVACFGGADIFLGISVLRKLHLLFAFGEKTLYATAADLTADSTAAPGTPAAPPASHN